MTDPGRVLVVVLLVILGATDPCLSAYKSGECYFNTKGSCEHMGQVYGIGESWKTSDCYQCVCMEPFGVGCCEDGSPPVDYPAWCEVVEKPDHCSTVAVMKANHKIPCLWRRGRLRSEPPWKADNDPMF